MSGQVWRFAGFEYSPITGLKRDGAAVPIGPQARQLLELLLRSNGAVVSKAEIASTLWPGRPPSDDSIDRCAYLLRKPLRDAGGGDVVATAYGRGLSLRARIFVVDPDLGAGRSRPSNVDGRIAALWQTAYELSGGDTRGGFERAQRAVEEALAVNPESPEIRTLAADMAIARAMRGFIGAGQAREMIEANASRALAGAADHPPALAALGWASAALSSAPRPGLDLLDRAVGLDKRGVKALLYRGWTRASGERLDPAISDIDAGLSLAPLDQTLLGLRAWLEICAGDVAGGGERARDGLERRPAAVGLALTGAIAASLLDRHDDAIAALAALLRDHPGDPVVLSVAAYVRSRAGLTGQAREALAELGPAERAPSIHAAAALLALGRPEEAIRLLGTKSAEGCPFFVFAAHDPRLAQLRPEIRRMRQAASRGQG